MRKKLISQYIKVSRLRLGLAHQSNIRFFHFSYIFDMKGKLRSNGINKNTPLPKEFGLGTSYTIHSEIDALLKFMKTYSFVSDTELEILNIRLNKRGQLRNARPCKQCMALLRLHRFKYAYYSTNDGIEKIRIQK